MSWFDPPPLIEKPLHPSVRMPRPPGYRRVYLMGIVLWLIAGQIGLFMTLVVRRWMFGAMHFLPPKFGVIEMIVCLVFFVLGNWVMTNVLATAMIVGDPSHDQKNPPAHRE